MISHVKINYFLALYTIYPSHILYKFTLIGLDQFC